MGHDKLRRFKENEGFACLLQPCSDDVVERGEAGLVLKPQPVQGQWNSTCFASSQPIVLELGCGRGEYTVDLALRNTACNYVGVDIKGARLWKGAKYAHTHRLPNAAFLRTRIEFIEAFFAPGEVSEIWLTFPDPQMKSENSRLTAPVFMERYRKILRPGGVIHLKTDSMFLHQYTKAMIEANGLRLLAASEDLHGGGRDGLKFFPVGGTASCGDSAEGAVLGEPTCGSVALGEMNCGGFISEDALDALFSVRTHYEEMFAAQGYKITYLAFTIDLEGPYLSPDFDAAYWRSIEGPRKSGRQSVNYCL